MDPLRLGCYEHTWQLGIVDLLICQDERAAIMALAAEADGMLERMRHGWPYQQANAEVSALHFSVVATASTNGHWMPARLLCVRERDLQGSTEHLSWDALAGETDDARSIGEGSSAGA